MDIEIFKEIVKMCNGMTSDAKDIAIIWMCVKHGVGAFFGLVWSCIGIFALKLAYNLTQNYLSGEILRRSAGVSIFWNRRELDNACTVLRENRDKI